MDHKWCLLKHLLDRTARFCKQKTNFNDHKCSCQDYKVCPDWLILWQRNDFTADEETPAGLSAPMLAQPGTPSTLVLSLRLLLPTASMISRARLKVAWISLDACQINSSSPFCILTGTMQPGCMQGCNPKSISLSPARLLQSS